MSDTDRAYYRTRAAQEIGLALNAAHGEARQRHKELADAYLELLGGSVVSGGMLTDPSRRPEAE